MELSQVVSEDNRLALFKSRHSPDYPVQVALEDDTDWQTALPPILM